VGGACRSIGMKRPEVVQSMYIFKSPKVGGEVKPHQDGTYLFTEPQSCTGFWWALDDCRTDNGCLFAVPGSHKSGVQQQFRRTKAGMDVGLVSSSLESKEDEEAAPSASEGVAKDDTVAASIPSEPLTELIPPTAEPFDLTHAVPVECPAGTLVILHGALVHYSNHNHSDKKRHAYAIHIVDSGDGIKYPRENWLQRSDGKPFPALYEEDASKKASVSS